LRCDAHLNDAATVNANYVASWGNWKTGKLAGPDRQIRIWIQREKDAGAEAGESH